VKLIFLRLRTSKSGVCSLPSPIKVVAKADKPSIRLELA